MFETLQALLENLLAPMVSVQIFSAILIYFTIVRKRIAADYKLYVCFLLTFIFFLIGRILQGVFGYSSFYLILFVRMGLLFGVGIPSLLVAAAVQSGINRSKALYVWPYTVGIVISLAYIVFADAGMQGMLVSKETLTWLPFPVTVRVAHKIQIAGAVIMLVLPCGGLMIRELKERRNRNLLAFLVGAFLFGVFFVVGTVLPKSYWIYYVGSIFSGLCWGWAVFQDIRDMKGRMTLLKEELQFQIQSGRGERNSEIERLLDDLEQYSRGNLGVYKMRIREILSMLIDTTIEAGGDTEILLQRNTERNSAIETSMDPDVIREMARAEAVELSKMIAEIPEQKSNKLIEQAVAYLETHFREDLSVDELAESLGISRSHLMREFKKGTGKTVNQYMTALRIEQAKKVLETTSVTDTAFEVGYNNSNYFSTVFKKQTGLSPLEFQKTLKKRSAGSEL
ncbi:AraC family transcriptional regulator [Pontiella agarivorans]|uniref:AraC family transcriptional regulator n=1 Tax=Pontiella agarivorans TaxID=3038953 RepID=A0ABU5MYC1_9BACT|nr:AraC family transcriptional regulator [Pontiella agarivorans]MDZ8119174.1 AraC family transcriptional regulator [Pontiella agarivorans]